jgi:hypothetical protein
MRKSNIEAFLMYFAGTESYKLTVKYDYWLTPSNIDKTNFKVYSDGNNQGKKIMVVTDKRQNTTHYCYMQQADGADFDRETNGEKYTYKVECGIRINSHNISMRYINQIAVIAGMNKFTLQIVG